MKKHLSKILILILVTAIFIAPISVGVKINDKGNPVVGVEMNKVRATEISELLGESKIKNIQPSSNLVSFDVDIIFNQKLSTTKNGSVGVWNIDNENKGTWEGKNNTEGESGKWKNDNSGGSGNYTEQNGYWVSTSSDGTSGTWKTGKNSGTWIATKGKGGSGEAIWRGGNIIDLYSNIGGSDNNDPRTGIKIIIKKNGTDTPITNKDGSELWLTDFSGTGFITSALENNFSGLRTASILEADTIYTIQLEILGNKKGYLLGLSRFDSYTTPSQEFKTLPKNANDPIYEKASAGTNTSSGKGITNLNLGCSIFSMDGIYGCIAGIFYMVWEVSAVIAKFAGTFLDFFVYYSTNSSSYTNEFVSQAWGAVRDIANIFFIIALLYVAIKTILGLNVTDNKKLIGTIIIIALVINFSLFTTKIVIDGSNILAKVFYNNIVSKDDKSNLATGASGQKSISIGLIEKYDPQSALGKDAQKKYEDSRGGFIFITIFLIAITLYTAYIFFSVALLFVARVVSLWLAMIFSPIAFASYTVPFEIPGFGHKEWWKNLLDNALLAPVFIFILYIVILFAGFLKTITDKTDSLLTVAIPFIILAVLLREGKKLAVKYSGEMGEGMVKAGAILGGLAIGGASMGVAAVGRGTVGAFMKGASTGDSINQRYARGEHMGAWDTFRGGALHYGTLGLLTGAQRLAGKGLNWNQAHVEEAMHARHELDTVAGAVANGKKWDELNGEQRYWARRKLARDKVVRDNKAAGAYIIDPTTGIAATRRQVDPTTGVVTMVPIGAFGTRNWDALSDEERTAVDASEAVGNNYATGHAIPGRALANNTTWDDINIIPHARHKQGTISAVIQSGVTGGYDVRDLSKLVAREQTRGFTKLTTGLTAAVASGMRGGLKGALNINYGEGQKNFFKDLGHTVSEAMKGAKINVDLSHIGEQKKEGDKSGGGHH